MTNNDFPLAGKLRPYQARSVDDLRAAVAKGNKTPLLVAPCGSGKTIVGGSIIESALAKGSYVLFLAPRRELIFQTSRKLNEAGVHHGMVMAGCRRDYLARVQIACIPTLHSRLRRDDDILPPANLIIVDEAHLALARTTREIIERYPEAVVIGMTATPCRSDGVGLGDLFDGIVQGPLVRELIDGGYLVQPRYYAPTKPDLDDLKIRMGDYEQKALASRMDTPKLVGDVVSNWQRLAGDRRTVVFSVNVQHSRHLRDEFLSIGVSAEHLDGRTPHNERADILARFDSGETQVITNCQIFAYGVDCPPASCCVLAHPTKSLAKYHQAVGRVLRPYPGKTDCLVIDHAGIVDQLGFVEDDIPWTLDGKSKIADRVDQQRAEGKEPKAIECRECKALFTGSGICPWCGCVMRHERKKAIAAIEADLQEVTRGKSAKKATANDWPMEKKEKFFRELVTIGKKRGYKTGWAANQYHSRMKVWPNGLSYDPLEPSPETLRWVKSREIAYWKRRVKNG